jgi:hypothetical protein
MRTNLVRLAALIFALAAVHVTPVQQQAGFRLPADLYVLTGGGQVERYALGGGGAQPITPASVFVVDFGIDAAGERLAYRTEQGLFLMLLGLPDVEPLPIEGPTAGVPPYRGRGDTIAWSPPGDAIAYTTLNGARIYFEAGGGTFVDLTEAIFLSLTWSPGGTYLAAEGENNVWWIYRRTADSNGVPEMTLTSIIPSSAGMTFVSDPELIFAPEEGGLRLMNLAAANAQTLILDESVQYRYPTLTARDELAFFARPLADPSVEPGYGILQTLARGAAQVVTVGTRPIPLNGLRWASGGQWLIAFQGGVLALIDPRTGEGMPFSVRSAAAYAWGPLRVDAPGVTSLLATAAPTQPFNSAALSTPIASAQLTVGVEPPPEGMSEAIEQPVAAPTPTFLPIAGRALPADGFFFNPGSDGATIQVWRLNARDSAAFAFTGATASVSEFASAPDGRAVAYVSAGALWLQRLEVRTPARIAVLTGFAPITPVFSPDGTRIAYVDETPETGGIWIAALDGSAPRRVLANISAPASDPSAWRAFRRPQWSPDGTRLLVDAYLFDRAGGPAGAAIGVLTLASGAYDEALPETPADDRALTSRWLFDGRILTYADAGSSAAAGPEPIDRGFYLFDGGAPADAPAQWIPLPATALVRAVMPVDSGRFRALLADAAYPSALLRVVDVSGSGLTDILVLPPLSGARLSPDAEFAAGLLDPVTADGITRGALAIVDLTTGGQFILTDIPAIWGFRWAGG